jgi:hypothetical protein
MEIRVFFMVNPLVEVGGAFSEPGAARQESYPQTLMV